MFQEKSEILKNNNVQLVNTYSQVPCLTNYKDNKGTFVTQWPVNESCQMHLHSELIPQAPQDLRYCFPI